MRTDSTCYIVWLFLRNNTNGALQDLTSVIEATLSYTEVRLGACKI